jgi:hypothetical protein
MSWEAEWQIERMPTREELEHHLTVLVEQARLLETRIADDDADGFNVTVILPVESAEDIPFRLGFAYRTRDDVRADLDPPRPRWVDGADQVPDDYCVTLDVVSPDDDEPAIVRVYANDSDNRAAWPIAHDLGLALAQRLGMRVAEEDDEEEDDEPSPFDVPEDQLN